MADLSDVEAALVALILTALYPTGTEQPCIIDPPVRAFRGEPGLATLERDLAVNVSNVSVFPVVDTTRNTTRWLFSEVALPGIPTLSVETTGATATFRGTGGVGQIAGIIADEQAFVYRGRANDTPALVAAMLAAAIRQVQTCWLSGSALTIPSSYRLIARTVADGVSSMEWCRQEQSFRIGIWSSTPTLRDKTSGAIQTSLATIPFLTLSDGSCGRLRFRSMSSYDTFQAFRVYRRELVFDVEYATIVKNNTPSMLFGDLIWADATFYS